MINKNNYSLNYGHLERTEAGTEHFHFYIVGPDDETLYFYTFKDMSGFKCNQLDDPLDYILFGTLLLLLKDEIYEEMRHHRMDAVTPLLDHMKVET